MNPCGHYHRPSVLWRVLHEAIKSGALRLILVPHEPTKGHLQSLEKQLAKMGIKGSRYSQAENWDTEVLLVDQIGILAELYSWGDIAFVGGSFRGSVHSVMEPLAAGLITLVGPHHGNNREALEFKSLPLPQGPDFTMVISCRDKKDLKETLAKLAMNRAHISEWKSTIQDEVQRRTGATARLTLALEKLVPMTSP